MTSAPLIYVAATRRTGSTMLAELLSAPPHSFVFREPRLPRGRLRLKPETAQTLAETDLDVRRLSAEMNDLAITAAIERFRDVALSRDRPIPVIGVKEIRHEGVDEVSRVFTDMRVIVTTRDPRDIYLSLYHKREELQRRGVPWADPEALAGDLRTEFGRITTLMQRHEHLAVRYEDLVDDPALIETTRRFAGVRIQGTGLLGRTSSVNRERHGHEVGTSRCGLWQNEPDGEGLANALAFRDLVPEYADFQASIPGTGRVED